MQKAVEIDVDVDEAIDRLVHVLAAVREMAKREDLYAEQRDEMALVVSELHRKAEDAAQASHRYHSEAQGLAKQLETEVGHWRGRALFAEQFVPGHVKRDVT